MPNLLFATGKKSVLVFTKSSGWEHDVVKRVDGKLSIVEQAVTSLGNQHGFNVTATKEGGVFDSNHFHSYSAVVFFINFEFLCHLYFIATKTFDQVIACANRDGHHSESRILTR